MIKDLLMEDRYRFNGTVGFFYNTDPECRELIYDGYMNADLDNSQNDYFVFFPGGSPDPTFIEFSDDHQVTKELLNHKLTIAISRGTPVKSKRVISALFEHNYIGIFFMLQGGVTPISRYS